MSVASLLDRAAFDRAHDESRELAVQQRAYDALRDRVGALVVKTNETLTLEGWKSLVACHVDIGADETTPACSMDQQEIQCGMATRLAYREPELDIRVRGRSIRSRAPNRKVHRASIPGNREALHQIRGCVSAAFYEPVQGVAVLRLEYACRGGGDACYAPDRWEIVRLPVAPGPEPSVSAGECPKGMTAIPGGSLTMGALLGEPNERRPHESKVGAFCLDTTEVTVADYRACLKAGRCFTLAASRWAGPGSFPSEPPETIGCNDGVRGREKHPMNCVPWSFAREYCDARGMRLPSEEEWEFAARGSEGRLHPWGAAAPPQGVCWSRAIQGTCEVGASRGDVGPFGVLDLAGNVAEWTATPDGSYGASALPSSFMTRGGSFAAAAERDLRGTRGEARSRGIREANIGFRCARSR